MAERRFEAQWRGVAEGSRECGSCYACCTWLGIEELKKWTGQPCRHLCGGNDPSKRCSIYDKRPTACAEYTCMWKQGYGPDELQPNRSGILLTGYQSEINAGGVSVTAIVFDEKLAEKWVERVTMELATLSANIELRVVNVKRRTALYFLNGNIYQCRLLPADTYESLRFEADERPIGRYRVERGNDDNMGGNTPNP